MSESRTVSTISPGVLDRENVDHLTKKRGEPDWLKKLRLANFESYIAKANPSLKADEWRKTLIETVDLEALGPLAAEKKVSEKLLKRLQTRLNKYFPDASGFIYEVDGDALLAHLDPELAAKGVVLESIEVALKNHESAIKKYLSNEMQAEDGKLALMAGAFFTSGVFLHVPKNVVIEKPIILVTGFATCSAGQALFPRIIVAAEDNAVVNVINVFSGLGDEKREHKNGSPKAPAKGKREWFLSSALVDVFAGSNSTVRYVELQQPGDKVFSVVRNHNRVGKDAKFYSLGIGLGGGQLKSDVITVLTERGAHADVFGVAFGDHDEHVAYNTVQNHDAPDTTSNINFRVALKGQAVSSYQGNIKVSLTASRTDAFQSNKNLLLSAKAKAESIPRLEILTDDVKCSHGATVGPVDKNQVFYLMSRGLNEKIAEELIVGGFFNTILSSCPIEGTRDWIDKLITDKIHGDNHE